MRKIHIDRIYKKIKEFAMWPFKKTDYKYDVGNFSFRYPEKLKLWNEDDITTAFERKTNKLGIMRVGVIPVGNNDLVNYTEQEKTVKETTNVTETIIGDLKLLFDKTITSIKPVDLKQFAEALAKIEPSLNLNNKHDQINFAIEAFNYQKVSTYYWFFGKQNLYFRWSYRVLTALENTEEAKAEIENLTEFVFKNIEVQN